MAKSKKGPALFELWGKSGDREPNVTQIPKWWSSGRGGGASAPVKPAGHLTLVTEDHGSDEPLFEVDGRRLRFSFTSVSAAAVTFGILAVVTVAYIVGSRSAESGAYKRGFEAARSAPTSTATDEIQLARNQPPATHLLAPLTGQPATTSAPAKPVKSDPTASAQSPTPMPQAKGWVQDLTYIVIQEFNASGLEKVKEAQKFLAEKGVDAAVVTLAGGGVHLITTQGYNHKDAAQKKAADQQLAKVRAIGLQYYAAGGGYKLEGYYKSLKKPSW